MYEIKYRKSEEMKDGLEPWYEKIPKDWLITKIKFVSMLSTGNSISATEKDVRYSEAIEEYIPYIGTKDIDLDSSRIEYENGLFIPIKNQFKIALNYSALFCIEGGSAGRKIGFLEKSVCYGNKLCNIKGKAGYDSKFLYYILQSYEFKKQFFLKTTGIIPGVSIDQLKTIQMPKITREEQNKIANFLDIKTGQFDTIISKKENLIKKLEEAKKSLISEVVTGKVKIVDGEIVKRQLDEMKDSGVEWLGMIPKEWGVKKLKHIVSLKSGDSITSEKIEEEGEFPVYGGNGLRGYTTKHTHDGVYILIGRQGALCGNINYARNKFWASEHAVVVNELIKVNINWLGELLRIMNLNQYSMSAAQPGLSVNMIENLNIPYPSLTIQNDLSDVFKHKLLNLEKVIKKIYTQIQKLKQAKQSLISEAVTGKIDLRDWEIIEEGEL